MKKTRLVILGVVLVLCAACYLLLGRTAKTSGEDTANAEDGEAILAVPADRITGFSFTVGKNTYSFLKNEEQWNYSGDPNFPADTDKIEQLLSDFAQVNANRVLTEVSDLTQYGLSEPSNILSLTDSEGNTYVLHIGNLNSSTGDYYAYTGDEKTVYTIDSTIPLDFQLGLYDLAKTESFPAIDAADVSLFEVEIGEKLFDAYKDASSNTGWLLSDAEQVYEGDDSKLLTLLDQLGSISYQSCLEYDCQNSQAYGLDHPTARIRVRYADGSSEDDGEKEVAFLIGSQDEAGSYFIQREGTGEVHTVAALALSDFLEAEVSSYRSLALSPLSMDQVSGVTVTYEGKEAVLVQTETTTQNEDGEDVTSYSCTRNGKAFDTDTYQDFFKTASGMQAQGYTDASADTDAVCVICFTRTDGGERVVSYYSYDEQFYLAKVSDDGQESRDAALVNKMDVAALLSKVEQVLQ